MTNDRNLDWLQDLEDQYKRNHTYPKEAELLDLFPEAKGILPEKLMEWKNAEQKSLSEISSLLAYSYKLSKSRTEYMIYREMIKYAKGLELRLIRKHISRIKRLISIASGRKWTGQITQAHIDQANSVPIRDLYVGKLRRSGRKWFGLCPFHKEKHGSFCVYQDTNSWWCFGCQKGGNAINYIKLLHGYTFRQAVRYLIGK